MEELNTNEPECWMHIISRREAYCKGGEKHDQKLKSGKGGREDSNKRLFEIIKINPYYKQVT